jgi:hypothetical protein
LRDVDGWRTLIDVHRRSALTIARVGADYRDGRFTALLGITGIAGLTVSLDGLAVSSLIAKWGRLRRRRAGPGLSQRDAVETGGALRRQPVVLYPGENPPLPGFADPGCARTRPDAAGAGCVEIDGEPSLFIYAVPTMRWAGPFFFVTGLAAGLGYHRRLNIPSLEQPFRLSRGRPVAEVAASSRDPVGALQA